MKQPIISVKCKRVRAFYRHLRKVLPTEKPTRLIFADRLEDGWRGGTQECDNTFVIALDVHQSTSELMNALFDEYAHALAWTPNVAHSNAWGTALARITRAWEKYDLKRK